jgi:hypothetical protein
MTNAFVTEKSVFITTLGDENVLVFRGKMKNNK